MRKSPEETKTRGHKESLPPNTTAQEDMVTAGQRRVSMIWEVTQSLIAIFVTVAIIFNAVNKILSPELTNAFFLVLGFYFARTNHSAIGGPGKKATDSQVYVGR